MSGRIKGVTFVRSTRGADETGKKLMAFLQGGTMRVPATARVTYEVQPQDPTKFEWVTIGENLTAQQKTTFLAEYPYLAEDANISDD